jgi:hypothetical protein
MSNFSYIFVATSEGISQFLLGQTMFNNQEYLTMKKVIALVFALGLFAAAPAMAAEDILTGVAQYEVTALADTEMSQIQGQTGVITILGVWANLDAGIFTSPEFLAFTGSLLGTVLGVLGGLI